MSSIDTQIQQFECAVQTHATARINSDLEVIKTTMDRRATARIELIRAADALDAQLSAAQARIAELVTALDAMTEYAGEHIAEYKRIYAGYDQHDQHITRMESDLANARAALAGVEPATRGE